jgi:hypothetical protein
MSIIRQGWKNDKGNVKKTAMTAAVLFVSVLWLIGLPHMELPAKTRAPIETPQSHTKPGPKTDTQAAPPIVSTPAPMVITPDASVPGVSSIFGVWQGSGHVVNRNADCTLSAEIRENPAGKENTFRVYTTMSCPVFLPLWLASHTGEKINPYDLAMKNLSTTESVLTGSVAGEELVFSHVEDTASVDAQGCALESLRVRGFGNDKLLAHFREGQCEGGDLQMMRRSK